MYHRIRHGSAKILFNRVSLRGVTVIWHIPIQKLRSLNCSSTVESLYFLKPLCNSLDNHQIKPFNEALGLQVVVVDLEEFEVGQVWGSLRSRLVRG